MTRNRIVPASLIALFLAAGAARAEEAPPTPSVTTTGSATVYVAPDRVDLRFTVQTFEAELPKAKAAGDEAAARTLAFLKEQGVPEAQVRADFARSEAVYDQSFDNGRPVRGPLKGYQVTRSYGVRLDDVAAFAGIVDRLLTDPAVQIDGYAFSAKDDRTHRDEARRRAVRAAREKAALLAGELGMTIGDPLDIQELNAGPITPMYRTANALHDAGGGGGEGAALSPVGQIEVRGEVTVRFRLARPG